MPCRVGMTTTPLERLTYWKGQYPTLANWRILSQHSTKAAAQQAESQEARSRSCVSGPGGAGPEYATWYVYYFSS